jgi:hypothetical protein
MQIRDVKVGDMCLDGSGKLSPVYLIGHSSETETANFVALSTASGAYTTAYHAFLTYMVRCVVLHALSLSPPHTH